MITQTQQAIETVQDENKQVNLYRTRWLIAHNALHDLVHKTILGADNVDPTICESVEKQFSAYLAEQQRAPEITSRPA